MTLSGVKYFHDVETNLDNWLEHLGKLKEVIKKVKEREKDYAQKTTEEKYFSRQLIPETKKKFLSVHQ